VVVAVDQRLVVHHRVQRRQQRLLDADFAVEQFEDGDDRVGRARRRGNQPFATVEFVLVDAGDDRRVDIAAACAGVGQQQARAAGGQEALQLGASTVDAGTFDDEIDVPPVDVFRRARMADPDALLAEAQFAVDGLDRSGEAAVRRVVAGQVGDAVEVGRLVDRADREAVGDRRFAQGAQEAAADPAVAVDREA